MNPIPISEIIRAVDVFLFKFDCPECRAEQLTGTTPGVCADCGHDLSVYPLKIEDAERRLLAGYIKRRKKGISKKVIQALHRMQNGQCAYCDVTLCNYHVDHIVPFVVGGTNNFNNLALACEPCNLTAGGMYFADLLAKRRWIIEQRARKRRFNFVEVSA